MALAYKCDRCGGYFDKDKDSYGKSDTSVLCLHCMKMLELFMSNEPLLCEASNNRVLTEAQNRFGIEKQKSFCKELIEDEIRV